MAGIAKKEAGGAEARVQEQGDSRPMPQHGVAAAPRCSLGNASDGRRGGDKEAKQHWARPQLPPRDFEDTDSGESLSVESKKL